MSDNKEFQFEENQNTPQPISYRMNLNDLSQEEIIRIFDKINEEKRYTIIPIGFPAAGKSLFLSSLMYYAEKDTLKLWNPTFEEHAPFDNGFLSKKQMVKYFNDKKAYPVTTSGTIDIIGIDVKPQRNLKPVKYAFVDLAGEDLQKIAQDGRVPTFDDKIIGVLRGCETGNPIFCLVTPYIPKRGNDDEDELHSLFLNHIKVNYPNLYTKSQFVIIVSQWDNKPKEDKLTVEDYIKNKRQSLYNSINEKGAKIIYGEYSVGDLTETLDKENKKVVLIRRIDHYYPHNFWNSLYTLVTGKNFENKGWFAKLIKMIFG